MTGTLKTTTIGKRGLKNFWSRRHFIHMKSSRRFFKYSITQLFYTLDVVVPASAVSSGDYYGFDNDGSSWSIKEYGSKDNAYSLCTFIGKEILNLLFYSIKCVNKNGIGVYISLISFGNQ